MKGNKCPMFEERATTVQSVPASLASSSLKIIAPIFPHAVTQHRYSDYYITTFQVYTYVSWIVEYE